jgi:hypothetical protein
VVEIGAERLAEHPAKPRPKASIVERAHRGAEAGAQERPFPGQVVVLVCQVVPPAATVGGTEELLEQALRRKAGRTSCRLPAVMGTSQVAVSRRVLLFMV